MPKWRKLHVKVTESIDLNEMPNDFTRLLWVLLPLALDREGRSLDNPSFVKSRVMPLRDDVGREEIEIALNWFANHQMLFRYGSGARTYFYVPNFHKYQGDTKREAESNYPAPPDDLIMQNSRVDQEEVMERSMTDVDSDVDVDSDSLKPSRF